VKYNIGKYWMNQIKQLISEKLSLDITHWLIISFEFMTYSLIVLFVYYLFKKNILNRVRNKIKDSGNNFGNYLIKHNLFTRVAALVPIGVIAAIASTMKNPAVVGFGDVATTLAMCFFVVAFIYSFLNAVVDIAANKGFKKLPLKPISQMIKIIISLLAIIIVYSKLIGESPSSVLAGIGALSAILLLVFKDTLHSLVASFQITFFDTVRKNDWITIDSMNVDGDVIDINLSVITIKGFDNTTTIIPTHSLMNHSYKNYRDMFGRGRRIKRAINIDVNSCKRLEESDLERLEGIDILSDYIKERKVELEGLEKSSFSGTRYMTNIGTFRKYVHYYLSNHPEICKNNTVLIRQLDEKGEGIPLELYCFTHNTGWGFNEDVKSDVFDHLYTILKEFDLKVYQRPTGDFSFIK
jgi:miniconductance mechanosensitive channel